jgi:hypothetical protein
MEAICHDKIVVSGGFPGFPAVDSGDAGVTSVAI